MVALCGVNQRPDGRSWATLGLCVHPGDLVHEAAVEGASADEDRFEVRAGDGAFRADDREVHMDLGGDAVLHATLHEFVGFPRRPLHGGGVASLAPFLNQYWHPHILGGRATVTIGGDTFEADHVYAEKNWGTGFPPHWWWGQAQAFRDRTSGTPRPDVCLAFSGGHLAWRRLGIDITGVVLRWSDRLLRLAPPLAWAKGGCRDGEWDVVARSPRWTVTIHGEGRGVAPHSLPVPVPTEGRNITSDFEHLAGRITLVVHRRGVEQPVLDLETDLAGLEWGFVPTSVGGIDRGGLAMHRSMARATGVGSHLL